MGIRAYGNPVLQIGAIIQGPIARPIREAFRMSDINVIYRRNAVRLPSAVDRTGVPHFVSVVGLLHVHAKTDVATI